MKFLGIDIGSSYIKSALLDVEKDEVRDIKKAGAGEFLPAANTLIKENDPADILDSVKRIIADGIRTYNKIEGVLFSTQMHGFLLTNEKGENVTNYISWQDERSTEQIGGNQGTYLERIRKLLDGEDVRKSGTPIKPALAMCNLYHLLRHIKPEKPLRFCTLGDYIISELTGEKPVCHITNAASTGIIDLETGKWSESVICKLGFERLIFPELVHENTMCGVFRTEGKAVGLYPAVADHQAAMYGAFLTPETDLAINIGTGSQICVASHQLAFGGFEVRPFFEKQYLRAVCHIPAGRALKVLVDFIRDIGVKVYDIEKKEDEIWSRINAYLDKVNETDLDVNISFFKTSVVPYGGGVKNINENNLNVENLFHGAFRNMVQNYYDFGNKMKVPGKVIERVICTGGIVRKNPVLLGLIEKKFGLPCRLAPYSEDTLYGLLRIAAAAAGNPEKPK